MSGSRFHCVYRIKFNSRGDIESAGCPLLTHERCVANTDTRDVRLLPTVQTGPALVVIIIIISLLYSASVQDNVYAY